MLYPYNKQFLLFEEIKSALNGYGRFIYFRTFNTNHNGDPDPTFVDINKKDNWIESVKEGEFKEGKANGFQRQLIAFNGHCKLGFFKDDQPHGKFVEYDNINGGEWQKMGIYQGDKKCI